MPSSERFTSAKENSENVSVFFLGPRVFEPCQNWNKGHERKTCDSFSKIYFCKCSQRKRYAQLVVGRQACKLTQMREGIWKPAFQWNSGPSHCSPRHFRATMLYIIRWHGGLCENRTVLLHIMLAVFVRLDKIRLNACFLYFLFAFSTL